MSRIGKKPISIPPGVEVSIKDDVVTVNGTEGKLVQAYPSSLKVSIENGQVRLQRMREDKQSKALHGTFRSLIFNMIKGVSEGYQKELKIVGTGYRARLEEKKLILNLGFSHAVEFMPPPDVTLEVPDATTIRILGCDKQKVGETAAEIRHLKKPEPYKGKGIRYKDEYIKLKVGKAALGSKG